MSPSTFGPNDVLKDDNYFLWEFNARMTLARKDLLDHVMVNSEQAMQRENAERRASVTGSRAKLHCSNLAQSVDIGLSPHATKVSVLGYEKAPKQPNH
jgi:hypothetical protein